MSSFAAPFATTVSGLVLIPLITALLLALILYVARKFAAVFKVLNDAKEAAEDAQRVTKGNTERLTEMQRELRANGGMSLKDQVIRIEEKLTDQGGQFQRHLDQTESKMARLNRYLDDRGAT